MIYNLAETSQTERSSAGGPVTESPSQELWTEEEGWTWTSNLPTHHWTIETKTVTQNMSQAHRRGT